MPGMADVHTDAAVALLYLYRRWSASQPFPMALWAGVSARLLKPVAASHGMLLKMAGLPRPSTSRAARPATFAAAPARWRRCASQSLPWPSPLGALLSRNRRPSSDSRCCWFERTRLLAKAARTSSAACYGPLGVPASPRAATTLCPSPTQGGIRHSAQMGIMQRTACRSVSGATGLTT